ncbi:Phosphocarrier protein NPr [Vibrio stylophorae]|uniref:Phosphocarrier protein NPr n=1 Tax=Vibrio stylophorae TaxID=659351 RepID=A0ABM8ZQM0_9VIBR|nr:HPr family phosphocarrier protein [Vibrio stylophorae]CAH0532493.1 Phosphocarrier protein NPr [Vibrio stylophorae]
MTQTRTLLIKNRLGLHARAAMKLVELSQHYDAKLTVSNGEKEASTDSVMGLLLLESAQGQYIDVKATGSQALEALNAATALIESGFDEVD